MELDIKENTRTRKRRQKMNHKEREDLELSNQLSQKVHIYATQLNLVEA